MRLLQDHTLPLRTNLTIDHICALVDFCLTTTYFHLSIIRHVVDRPSQFHLSYSDKELLEREDRGESQQEILRRIAKNLPIYTRTNSGAIRFCDRCQLLKPDRCHHCSVCDKCILKMDHHCPWVNNCVGFSNYKYFMLFLAYSLLYCLFITATDLQYFIKFWTNGLPDTQAKFHILFLFFSASMFSVSLASLFIYHCWLVCKNRSTLEAVRAPVFRHGTDKNGFSLGISKNFRQVFGDEVKYWPVPVFSSPQDGRQFPSKPLRESQSRLLTTTPSWTDSETTTDKDRKGDVKKKNIIKRQINILRINN
uniref:Palmitoyltransferase n=1 Tax=Cynoglossus semilaevis TaxID=244447 RepID=A0A3P8WVU9_CYNSE